MPDSKITALASIGTGTDPANDPLVIVDVSDVSPGGMSATGTTKKVTLNNLLSSSPTATGNFTISGDLTVDTSTLKVDSANNRVGIGTASPAAALDVQGSSLRLQVQSSSNGGYATWKYIGKNSTGTAVNFEQGLNIAADNAFELYDNQNTQLVSRYVSGVSGAHSWFLTGSTAMTLNSTGLGVGQVPSTSKLEVGITNTSTAGLIEANALKIENNNATVNNAAGLFLSQTGNAGCGIAGIATSRTGGSRTSDLVLYYYNQATSASPIEGLRLTATGNVGIGVTPSYKLDTYTTLGGTVSEKRFANRTSNKIIVKRYFSITVDTALFSIECGTAGATNMAAFEINVFATGTKVGTSSDRQFYGKFYVTRNLAGTFTITSAFSSGSAGAFAVVASGTSLNVNGIFSVISDGSACVEISGYIGGRDTIAEANLTVTMP